MAATRHYSADEIDHMRKDLQQQLEGESSTDFGPAVAHARACLTRASGPQETEDCEFTLAALLVKEGQQEGLEEGLGILESQVCVLAERNPAVARTIGMQSDWNAPATDSESEQMMSRLFHIALAKYKLGETLDAVSCCSRMLSVSPHHRQALALDALCRWQERKEERAGLRLAVAGAVAGLVGVLGAGLLARRGRTKF
eukprot:TRINITY_DN2945_c0_g1_i1.p1 TRINITY_DN2945_c0_g1~~TRINITY_DN2945_c0_g1_i1.p1  ORF type:complete len:223 (+),score=78.25 TRINITY_DN2945_c0_g1_i1:73-669(+)